MIYGHEYGRQRRCPSVQVIAYNFLRHNSNMEPSLVCIFKVDLSFQNMKMGAMQLKRSFLTPNLGTGAVSEHTIWQNVLLKHHLIYEKTDTRYYLGERELPGSRKWLDASNEQLLSVAVMILLRLPSF